MNNIMWHNGEWKNDTDPVFTCTDRVRLGDGVFDTLLILNSSAQHLDRHFNRLKDNAKVMSLDTKLSFDTFETLISEIIRKNNAQSGSFALNTIISRGSSSRGLSTPANQDPQIILKLSPVPETFPDIHAHISQKTRRNEGSPLSQIKSCNYGDNVLAMIEAENNDCNEAIILNNAGHVTCSTVANIFCTYGLEVITPPVNDGVLDGIARQLFMMRYDVIEKSITQNDLLKADSIFVTNSIRGIQFIKSVNGHKFLESPLSFDKNFHINYPTSN